MSVQLEQIKKNCGYDPASPIWISRGGELMEYLGMEVMRVDFYKEGEGENAEWKNTVGKSLLLRADKYDPNTETVELVWKDVDYNKPEEEWEEHTTKIVPPGFSFGNPETEGKMTRFIPYSLHMKKMETEALFAKLGFLFQDQTNNKALGMNEINNIASSRDRINSLGHIHNIAVVVKPTNEEEIYTYRLGDITTRHQFKSVWKITAKDIMGKNEITVFIDDPDITNPNKTFEMRGARGEVEAEVKFYDLRYAFRYELKSDVDKKENEG